MPVKLLKSSQSPFINYWCNEIKTLSETSRTKAWQVGCSGVCMFQVPSVGNLQVVGLSEQPGWTRKSFGVRVSYPLLQQVRGWVCCPDWGESLTRKCSLPNCRSGRHPPALLAHPNLRDNLHDREVFWEITNIAKKELDFKA